jgi:hypothetical protein
MATMLDVMRKSLEKYSGKWSEKKGLWEFSTIIAERKAFLSSKKLTYAMKLRIDEASKTVRFSEMLMEASSGLSTGGDLDSGMSGGFGFKKESYNTFGGGGRQGSIEEQSKQFGKDFSYKFNYAEVRSKIQAVAESAGYKFDYQILPVK